MIAARGIAAKKLHVAIRADVGRGEGLIVKTEREREGQAGYAVIAVIADVQSARDQGSSPSLYNVVVCYAAAERRLTGVRWDCC
jgi:hypothetical protein